MQRNFLATLFLSQGIPMLLAGDEFGRTQRGNNNAYCQDNEISWVDWENADQDLLEFARYVIDLRREHPAFRRRKWFLGRPIHGQSTRDIDWFTPEGTEMSEEKWGEGFAKSLAVYLNGREIQSVDERGNQQTDNSFYLIFNAHFEPLNFKLPPADWGDRWEKILDTAADDFRPQEQALGPEAELEVQARSIVVFRHAD
jgi:glycogen operon protein